MTATTASSNAGATATPHAGPTAPGAGSTVTDGPAPASGSTLRWAIADTATIAGRTLRHWARQPGVFALNLLFPVFTLVMFGYLFGGAMTVPGGGDYREFLVPGVLGLSVLFGIEATVLGVVTDASKGVTDRLRSLPMSGTAVVAGRAVADMISATLGLAALVLAGLAVGWRWHEGTGQVAAALGLFLLLRFAFVWVGIYLGLVLKTPEAAMVVQILVWPLGFVSSGFTSPEDMPGWLGAIAEWNPVSSTITAARELFGNPGVAQGGSWIAENAQLMAIVWPLVLVAVFLPLAARRYRDLRR
ncbi:MAG TPA: ABC transporter permease [Acidimicrobiales bacterium]|nr:ABC transporter permease [Acidimicrobiales bacterium]